MKALLSSRSGVNTIFHGHQDGTFTIETVEDAEPILDANKRQQTDGLKRDREFMPVARVPVTVYQKWLQDLGIPFEQADEPDVRRLICQLYLNSNEFRFLRTTEGQI